MDKFNETDEGAEAFRTLPTHDLIAPGLVSDSDLDELFASWEEPAAEAEAEQAQAA
jgi:hypothetical protein